MSPFSGESTFDNPEQIDEALFNRYVGKKAFKVGAEERLVYQRVSNLRRVAVNHSILYNFSSEGAFTEQESIPITLIKPTIDEQMSMLWQQINI